MSTSIQAVSSPGLSTSTRPVASIGDEKSGFYVVCLSPSEDDKKAGFILSGTQGYEFSKWGVPALSYRTYILSDVNADESTLELELQAFITKVRKNKPSIILTLGNKPLQMLCSHLVTKKKLNVKKAETFKASLLSYYSGSLCQSSYFDHEHYVIPTMAVTDVWKQWDRRDETISIDIARAVEEYQYVTKNKHIRPSNEYDFVIDPDYPALVAYLEWLRDTASHVSVDIETIRPKKKSDVFDKHPGFPYTIALAPNKRQAVSFKFWRYSSEELVVVCKLLQGIFDTKVIIGQNFFSFDVNMLEAAMGFSFVLENIRDTKLRHHILHPELPHKLQFLCKQYTRQPYYKDEGHGWSPKSKTKLHQLLRYGAVDTVVTFEVYEGQEEELKERGLL